LSLTCGLALFAHSLLALDKLHPWKDVLTSVILYLKYRKLIKFEIIIMDNDQEKETHRAVNPGDIISDAPQTNEEKAQQLAVDSPDITGDHITVPTYFMVDEPDGEQKALHHVKDAEEISDVIRLARVDEQGNRIW